MKSLKNINRHQNQVISLLSTTAKMIKNTLEQFNQTFGRTHN
jgi:hypothetical protein